MPYRWTHDTGPKPGERLVLWPYRSLPLRGFAAVILTAFALLLIPVLILIGTVMLWFILGFSLLALAALWLGLKASYRSAALVEELTITDDEVHLVRREPDGTVREWRANPYWVEVNLHETGAPLPAYVTLRGNGREVEIGAFLSEEERRALYRELARRLPQR